MTDTTAVAVSAAAGQDKVINYKSDGEEVQLTIGMVKQFHCHKTKSGKLPTDDEVMNFIMLCKTQHLNPWDGDAYLLGYDGKDGPQFSLITSHASLAKRAESNDDFEGIESGVIVKAKSEDNKLIERVGAFKLDDDVLLGAWCKIYRKDKRPFDKKVKLTAYDKGMSLWKNMKETMIVKCVEAACYRAAYPSVKGYIQEEMGKAMDITTQVDVEPNDKIEAPKSITDGKTLSRPADTPPEPAPEPPDAVEEAPEGEPSPEPTPEVTEPPEGNEEPVDPPPTEPPVASKGQSLRRPSQTEML